MSEEILTASKKERALHHRFGKTTIAKVSDSDELRQMLVDPWLESETIIVKPNWVSQEPADFTDSEALRARKGPRVR